MKVAILAKAEHEFHSGVLIYKEAKRQGLDCILIKQTTPHEEIFKTIRAYEPDWTFVTGSRKHHKIYDLPRLAGSKVCVWCPDGVDNTRMAQWKAIEDKYELAIVVSTTLAETLPKAVWIPQFFDHRTIREDISKKGRPHDIAFMGTRDVRREEWLKKIESFCSVRRGGGSRMPYYVGGGLLWATYNACKMGVDIEKSMEHTFHDSTFRTSNRVFNVMGSGTFFLTFKETGLERLFESGIHYDTYPAADYEAFAEKVQYYLNHGKERREIARRGQIEVLEKHTLEVRIKEYWEAMNVCT